MDRCHGLVPWTGLMDRYIGLVTWTGAVIRTSLTDVSDNVYEAQVMSDANGITDRVCHSSHFLEGPW